MIPIPEGHLPAEQSVDFYLGLACNAATRAGISERRLERALGVTPGSLAQFERGERALDQVTVNLTWLFFNRPEFARAYAGRRR